MDAIVRAWVDGWVVSRGAAPPVREPWGVTIDVGIQAGHVTRHVFGELNDGVGRAAVQKVAGAVTGSGVWLKVFRHPAVVSRWLGPDWWIDPEPGCLMTLPLPLTTPPPPPPPAGYRVRTWTRGGVTRVLLAAEDGSLAARGQVAVTGGTAVVDQIETVPDHRRRGLGQHVVHTLRATAAAQGAHTCVLAGTPAGRALYETLGWQVRAPLTSARFTGPARG
ncbi:GNAT family N-acetyltransferase [Streptomyces sp. bgisy159]|uniref:GNAT family N-acetyltransferase n=1 Tax=Streptomyces sp. bgisy159 TaxID=3413795 RepID=UPI003F4A542F